MAGPPAATTPTAANWLAPVNVKSEKRHVCSTEKPAATLAAPKATPYAPTVTATLKASRTVLRGSGAMTSFLPKVATRRFCLAERPPTTLALLCR